MPDFFRKNSYFTPEPQDPLIAPEAPKTVPVTPHEGLSDLERLEDHLSHLINDESDPPLRRVLEDLREDVIDIRAS